MAKIKWKSREEFEEEINKPSEIELLKKENEELRKENEMIAVAIMELSTIVLNGGK